MLKNVIDQCVDMLDKRRIINAHDIDDLLTSFGVEPTAGRHQRVMSTLIKLGWQKCRSSSTMGFCRGFYLVSPITTSDDINAYCDAHDLSREAYVCRNLTYTPPPPDKQTQAVLRLQQYFLNWRDWCVSHRA